MNFWQYLLLLLGLCVVLVAAYWWVLLPWGDRRENRRAERDARRERGEYRPGD